MINDEYSDAHHWCLEHPCPQSRIQLCVWVLSRNGPLFLWQLWSRNIFEHAINISLLSKITFSAFFTFNCQQMLFTQNSVRNKEIRLIATHSMTVGGFSIIIQWNCSESRFNTASQRNCDIYFTSSVISKMIFHLFVTKNGDSCNAKQNLKD